MKVKVVNENNNNLEIIQKYKQHEENEEFVPKPIEIDWSVYDNWEDAADAEELAKNNNKLTESIKNAESSFM